MKNKNTEQSLQIAVVTFIKYLYPNIVIVAVRNEGKRSVVEGSIAKQMGMNVGCADLILFAKGKILFLELKSEKGKQTPKQKEFEKNISALGFIYKLCRNLQQVEECLKEIF